MRYITDLHIHSRFSRACSKNLSLSNLDAWARSKGIDVLATGDFTHPAWLKEIEERLEPAEDGLFRLKKEYKDEDGEGSYMHAPKTVHARDVRFFLSTEVACIYKKGGKARRLHLLLFAPNLVAVKRLVKRLEEGGYNLRSDGRPILGLGAKELLEIILEIDPRYMMVPAHAWTPWFSVFGSQSGFDSLEECFEDLAPEIHAIETGLSSDPPMNWRLSALDNVMLISNSDAHGVRNLGREANAFDLDEVSYDSITDILRKRDQKRFLHTIEFYPEEGKYYSDGHRQCDFSCNPSETERLSENCPTCGKPLTRGVLGRVHALADNPAGRRPDSPVDYRYIVPLDELIGSVIGKGRATQATFSYYASLLGKVGPEFTVLLDALEKDIATASSPEIADGVIRMRQGDVEIVPGYDGEFGKVKLRTRRQVS